MTDLLDRSGAGGGSAAARGRLPFCKSGSLTVVGELHAEFPFGKRAAVDRFPQSCSGQIER
jgi:hypothetical protein